MFWDILPFLRPVMQPGKRKDNLQESYLDSQDTPSSAETTDVDLNVDADEEIKSPQSQKVNQN